MHLNLERVQTSHICVKALLAQLVPTLQTGVLGPKETLACMLILAV